LASSGMGAALRQERLHQHLSLDDIAGQTRIGQHYLEAVENGRLESLPGLFFARSFVRQYALALKLDPEPMLAQLPKVDLASTPFPDPPVRPQPFRIYRSKWVPQWTPALVSMTWLGLAIAACAAAYFHFNQPPVNRPESAPPLLARQLRIAPAAQPAPPAQSRAARAVRSAPATAPDVNRKSPAATPPLSQETAAPPIQVVLTAHQSSWVQVTADGKTAFTGTLEPNDSRAIAADAQVKLVTGNAGGIAISLNGKALDPIGSPGQVRNIRLTAEGLQCVQKIQPEPDPL
jgi:cytoskeleton protein RodZ